METRPGLAREEDEHKTTPMHMSVHWDKIDVLRVLLEHDWSLGYVLDSEGRPILASAASRGYVGAARELLKHCPDAPYAHADGTTTCLHQAVQGGPRVQSQDSQSFAATPGHRRHSAQPPR